MIIICKYQKTKRGAMRNIIFTVLVPLHSFSVSCLKVLSFEKTNLMNDSHEDQHFHLSDNFGKELPEDFIICSSHRQREAVNIFLITIRINRF